MAPKKKELKKIDEPPKNNTKKPIEKDKPKSKKQKRNLSDTESDSDQSVLSDVDFKKKDDELYEKNNIQHGGDDDENFDDYDDNDEKENDENEDDAVEDEVEAEDEEEEKEKEYFQKNEGDIKYDEGEDDDCVYNNVKKNIVIDDDDNEYGEDHFFEDDENVKVEKYVNEDDRITTRKLTKYERVNIIATRAKQIELGAQKMVKNTKNLNPKEIAKLELDMKVCPIIIKRTLPSGAIELINVNTLEIIN
jgi:DNA-directed RNA polymerase subunit K/omega